MSGGITTVNIEYNNIKPINNMDTETINNNLKDIKKYIKLIMLFRNDKKAIQLWYFNLNIIFKHLPEEEQEKLIKTLNIIDNIVYNNNDD